MMYYGSFRQAYIAEITEMMRVRGVRHQWRTGGGLCQLWSRDTGAADVLKRWSARVQREQQRDAESQQSALF